MAPFSLRLMATDLITTLYARPQFFIGRLYPTEVLGFFDQAVKIREQPLSSAMQSVQNVTYPALAKIGDDAPKFAESYRQLLMMTAFALFPVMAGLIVVADELFPVLIGPQWSPTVPYFRVACLVGFFYPVAMVAYNVLKVRSDGRIIVRLEVVKKVLLTVVLFVTLRRSALAVMWGLAAMSFVEMCLNTAGPLPLRRIARTLLPVVLLTAVMSAAAWGAGRCTDLAVLRLTVEIVVGAVVYCAGAAVLRLEAFREIVAVVRRRLNG